MFVHFAAMLAILINLGLLINSLSLLRCRCARISLRQCRCPCRYRQQRRGDDWEASPLFYRAPRPAATRAASTTFSACDTDRQSARRSSRRRPDCKGTQSGQSWPPRHISAPIRLRSTVEWLISPRNRPRYSDQTRRCRRRTSTSPSAMNATSDIAITVENTSLVSSVRRA
jgi:hypothetical protein